MRTWNITPAFLVFLVAEPLAAQPKLGKYVCITDFSAAIMQRSDGTWAAGQIKAIEPEKQKFFVTIRVSPFRDFRRSCFTKQQGEALKYEPPPQTPKESTASGLIAEQHVHQKAEEEKRKADPNYTSPATDDPGEFIRVCLSNFTAAVTGHRELQSLDGTTFSDYQTNNVVFQLWDSTFHLYELNWANHTLPDFNDVVYRGRCELIQ
jgi:hypothetical protein